MRAGLMRRYCTIQRNVVAQGSYGEPIETWSTLAQRWMEIRPLGGREYEEAAKQTPEGTHAISMRAYLTTGLNGPAYAMDSGDRIVFHGRVFEVLSVSMVDERNREMRLICKERGMNRVGTTAAVPQSGILYSTGIHQNTFSLTFNVAVNSIGTVDWSKIVAWDNLPKSWTATGTPSGLGTTTLLFPMVIGLLGAGPANTTSYDGSQTSFIDITGAAVAAYTGIPITVSSL